MAETLRSLQIAALLACASACLCAQSSQSAGSLTGRLTDLRSKPLAGALVLLHNIATGEELRTATAKNGAYRFRNLAAGEYTIEAESSSHLRGHLEGITVNAGSEARIQTAMEFLEEPASTLAAVRAIETTMPATPLAKVTSVGLTSAATILALNPLPFFLNATLPMEPFQTFQIEAKPVVANNNTLLASTAKSPQQNDTPSTLAGPQLESLPANGHHLQQDSADISAAEVSSHDAIQQHVTIDGMNMHSSFGTAEADTYSPPLSTSIIRSMKASDTPNSIDIETTRALNELHGHSSYFDRQNSWGARNPFTQRIQQSTSATLTTVPVFTTQPYTPPDHEALWSIALGSRIRRDRLFWFAAVENTQRNNPGLATAKHPDKFFSQPSNDQMQVLSARLGLSSANPVAEGLAAYSSMLTTFAGLLGPTARHSSQRIVFARIDWQASERHSFLFEASSSRKTSPGGGLTRLSEVYGNHSFGNSAARAESLMMRWQAYLTPNLLAITQASVTHTIHSKSAEAPSAFEQTFLSPNLWGQLPQIVVDSRYGFTIGNPSRFSAGSYPDEHIHSVQESIHWVHNQLFLRAGLAFDHNTDATSQLRNQTGTYYYSNAVNFASDAMAFASYGVNSAFSSANPHNCDQTGRAWRDSAGNLRGLGNLPCYSYYSQLIGPPNWYLHTNNLAGYATLQWQPWKLVVLSAGLRWQRQLLPPPIPLLANLDLPLTQRLPNLGNNWAPRFSISVGNAEERWPILRFGYGIYYGNTPNAPIQSALTQTGSPNGDQNFFLRSTDNLSANGGGAPPFPYVLVGAPSKVVKPGVVEFASEFRNPEIHQAQLDLEKSLPGRVILTASAMVSLGRRLPISIDTNFDSSVNPKTITYNVVDGTGKGPIKTPTITVPFYASWPSATGTIGRLNPNYQQITQIMSRANSSYQAAVLRVARSSRKGINLHARYTYSHATDWNPNESALVSGSDVLDPADFSHEYGTSNLDVRHSASFSAILESPWKLRETAGKLANGWMLSTIGQYRSGLPYTMRTSGTLAEEFTQSGAAIVSLGPGMNGSGGDNRIYGVGRNTYRYPAVWKADLRVAKRIDLGTMRQLEVLAESFNLFNHQNVTELETTGYFIESGTVNGGFPSLNFLTGLKTNTTAFGQPLNINATNSFRERQIQLGVKMSF